MGAPAIPEECAAPCGENRIGTKIIYGLERCLRVWKAMRLQMKKSSQEKKQHREKVTSIVNQLALGEFKTTTVLRIKESGEWTEHGELVTGDRRPQKRIEFKVRRSFP
jgi:hypothetical protein